MTPARLLLAAAAVLPLLLPPAAATPVPNPGQEQAPAAAPGHDAAQAQSPAAPPTAAASHAPVPAAPAAAGPLSASRVPAPLPLLPGPVPAGSSASPAAAPLTAASLADPHAAAPPPTGAPAIVPLPPGRAGAFERTAAPGSQAAIATSKPPPGLLQLPAKADATAVAQSATHRSSPAPISSPAAAADPRARAAGGSTPADAPPAPSPSPDDLPVFCPVPAPAAAGGAAASGLAVPSRAEAGSRPASSAPGGAAAPPAVAAVADGAPPPQPPAKAPPPHTQPKQSPTAPPDSTAAPDADSLARTYRRTGVAASVERPTEALVPFGHLRPILRCAPLRACVVVLEPGELVLSTSLGDAERWLVQAAASGAGGATPILVVKPIACDLSTNLVVATDRRIYELALDSPPCRNADSGDATYNPRLQYTGVTRFYYPDELVRRWAGEEELARAEAERASQGRTPLAPAARLAHLNFDYSWDRGRRWPWVPSQVFDDGEHTYLALAPAARLADMPLLFALGPRGELTLINHHLEGQTMIADRVLERAVLIVGAAGKRDAQRLEIVNRAYAGSAATAATAARR
jgi:P-type conjugative transfer protein TrbG